MPSDRDKPVVDLQLDRAHSARIYDYFLGGKTNFLADRLAAGSVLGVFPAALVAARVNREFMHRATRFLAASGMRQFLDIGTGIPTPPNLHDIAQAIAPDARIVYTDNDPIVLAHAAALLRSTPEGRTAYVQADVTDPGGICTAPQLLRTLDLTRPVALSLNALMHFVTDDGHDRAHTIVETLKDALPSGSTLAVSHATPDFAPEAMGEIIKIYADAGTSLQFRSRAEFARFFDGWDLLEPGITLSHQWRPADPADATHVTDAEAACYAAVARKP
ncbi:SAM-dependent methyltransferase [Streptomyces celluloflavus]|uniref:SAM-dependent methyltransferase n=1 Tax=Streptomyces celluloflavus TaxID=58344 RepID=A0ABW7RAK2_9ACTN|nr:MULTISPECIES: SAM-dependent methyltransferase [Streptomyces]MYU55887.1 SAM-dependent methyltransferase [Streptomyces sp. SID7805]WSK11103.1 SAM-dependent methyltransferase [Streptomyces celluloflavus]